MSDNKWIFMAGAVANRIYLFFMNGYRQPDRLDVHPFIPVREMTDQSIQFAFGRSP